MIRVETVNGGYAEVIQHSKAKSSGKEIITFSLKYALIIHAEFLRHREQSRCVKSNRAIPPKKIRSEVINDPYIPVFFGKNQPGMVAGQEVRFPRLARLLWSSSRYPAVYAHWVGEKVFRGHKEWLNRMLNPWQWVRETVTATDWDNFYNLRVHEAAQKDIKVIAEAMYQAQKESTPMVIQAGEWHVPYIERVRTSKNGAIFYLDNDGEHLHTEQAKKASAARCARSSYDNHDKSAATYDGDKGLYSTLMEDEPKHASPVEHQATPMDKNKFPDFATKGVTHIRNNGTPCSGNFVWWVQNRQTIENHTCYDYKEK